VELVDEGGLDFPQLPLEPVALDLVLPYDPAHALDDLGRASLGQLAPHVAGPQGRGRRVPPFASLGRHLLLLLVLPDVVVNGSNMTLASRQPDTLTRVLLQQPTLHHHQHQHTTSTRVLLAPEKTTRTTTTEELNSRALGGSGNNKIKINGHGGS
jgi:hypothetical protein